MPKQAASKHHLRAILQDRRRTLKPDAVPLQTLEGLLEHGLAAGSLARDVILFPFNGSVDVLEDLLDRVGDFCTNTITGDESNLV